jgi:hypothetical protein
MDVLESYSEVFWVLQGSAPGSTLCMYNCVYNLRVRDIKAENKGPATE